MESENTWTGLKDSDGNSPFNGSFNVDGPVRKNMTHGEAYGDTLPINRGFNTYVSGSQNRSYGGAYGDTKQFNKEFDTYGSITSTGSMRRNATNVSMDYQENSRNMKDNNHDYFYGENNGIYGGNKIRGSDESFNVDSNIHRQKNDWDSRRFKEDWQGLESIDDRGVRSRTGLNYATDMRAEQWDMNHQEHRNYGGGRESRDMNIDGRGVRSRAGHNNYATDMRAEQWDMNHQEHRNYGGGRESRDKNIDYRGVRSRTGQNYATDIRAEQWDMNHQEHRDYGGRREPRDMNIDDRGVRGRTGHDYATDMRAEQWDMNHEGNYGGRRESRDKNHKGLMGIDPMGNRVNEEYYHRWIYSGEDPRGMFSDLNHPKHWPISDRQQSVDRESILKVVGIARRDR